MAELDDVRHEEFCLLVADGDTYAAAARATKISSSSNDDTIRKEASRLASKPHIRKRIDELRHEEFERVRAMAEAYKVDRATCLERAQIGWEMAFRKQDIVGMNQHNVTMARIAGLLDTRPAAEPLQLVDLATEGADEPDDYDAAA